MSETPESASNDLSPELLERLYRVGEACRAVYNEAQRRAAPVIEEALLTWEHGVAQPDTTSE